MLLHSFFAFSQTSEITKILNRKLENEIRAQSEDTINYYGEKFEVVKTFSIRDSIQQMIVTNADGIEDRLIQTGLKILSYELKHRFCYGGGYQIEKQEVPLDLITAIAKDVQILFETKPNAVKITRTNYYDDGRIENVTDQSDLFFTHLKYERGNEDLGYKVKKLFEKAGYEIKKGDWYD